jgi:hypothetical protein
MSGANDPRADFFASYRYQPRVSNGRSIAPTAALWICMRRCLDYWGSICVECTFSPSCHSEGASFEGNQVVNLR